MQFEIGFLLMPKSGEEAIRKLVAHHALEAGALSFDTYLEDVTFCGHLQGTKVCGKARFRRYNEAVRCKAAIRQLCKNRQLSSFVSTPIRVSSDLLIEDTSVAVVFADAEIPLDAVLGAHGFSCMPAMIDTQHVDFRKLGLAPTALNSDESLVLCEDSEAMARWVVVKTK
ncbi:hypothetical protein QIJ04_gp3 [ssRNA phage SRR6960803_2]|uniref:Uncharacterized protein n=1 Tax=ssRNA phage SRR6960803_2 TaxID=2786618 RepID=A0A8S5KZU4_9VIRU|nr:hypothetical protein QIJ04_gp3 [ssRNA phage SRR6960803_2]DAD50716.1 TPA_asm: hypothetical protein [ssRNA phage SRR6960803_2]